MSLDRIANRTPVPIIELAEGAWREIETTLGFKAPNPAVRRDIARYVARHLFDAQFPQVRPAHLRRWVKRIEQHAQALLNDLDWAPEDWDEASEEIRMDAWARTFAVHDLLGSSEQDKLRASLKTLLAAVPEALARIGPDRGGQLADEFAWGVVYDLAILYEWATKKRPTITYDSYHDPEIYKGPFLDFVDTVLRYLAPNFPRGNLALGKLIQRVLNIRHRERRTKD
jgi:hypothetical protein